jgi:hypothetical protein
MAYDELKTAAETARQRLQHGLWQLVAAQAWADEIIQRLDQPPEWLIAVSTAQNPDEAQAALLRADGEPDPREVWAALMGDWLRLLEAEPERDSEIGRVLFDLAMDGDVPAREAAGPMYSFWDAIDLAKAGNHGALAEERDKLREFLQRWSKPEDPPIIPLPLPRR